MTVVTVLGGTFAGVAAAVRLARVGHEVTLVADQLFAVDCPASAQPRDGDLRAAPR